MGIHDRDYYHDRPGGGFHVKSVLASIIALNVAIWLFQVITIRSRFRLEEFLAANPTDIFERFYLYFWQPLTANFLHAPKQIGHILGNMIFLFLFGREMEVLYGKLRFLGFYLAAGYVAILLEAAFNHYFSGKESEILIYGASGAVMATVVLFTTHFPRQEFYLILIPIPAWFLCTIFVALDLLGALGGVSPGETQIAFLAHLGGAAFGLLWRLSDFNWGRGLLQRVRSVGRRPRRLKPRRAPPPQPVPRPTAELPGESRDPVSMRIDELLEKIHRSGRSSLTTEELEYLQRNSGRYRSEK